MVSFLKSSFWSLLSVGSRTLSALVINKLISGQFGPQGITLLAHFQNLVTLATTIPSEGINMGLITFLAGTQPTDARSQKYFISGICWQMVVFLVVTGVFLMKPKFYFGAFWPAGDSVTWVGWFLLGLMLLLVSIYLQALLLARQALRVYTGLIAFTSLSSALLIWLFLKSWPLGQLLLLYLATQAITAFITVTVIVRRGWLPTLAGQLPDKAALRQMGKFILMALTLVICSKLVNFYVRDLMIKRFDLYHTGLWQAMVKLSDNYTQVFTALVGMVYYPRVAALVAQPLALRRYVRQVFFSLVPAVAVGLIGFYLLQKWFIILLFNPGFLRGAYLLDYLVLGDFFKMSAWLLSYLLMAQARTGLYMLVQIVAAAIYLGLLWWLVAWFGLRGVTMAHCASFGLFLGFNLIYFRKLIF